MAPKKRIKKGKSAFNKLLKTVENDANTLTHLFKKQDNPPSGRYKDFIGRKKKERKIAEKHKLKHYPTPDEIRKKRNSIKNIKKAAVKTAPVEKWMKTGIQGFDDLLEKGIPAGSAILLSGGAGSGKTIFALQILNYAASKGEKCLYISFEESEKNLKKHMKDFGWNPEALEKKGFLKIKQANAFDISTSVEALLAKAKGELLIELDEIPGLIPEGFKPDRIVLDSLSALAAAFTDKEETYRIYIEQLFRYFEKKGVLSFLISETEQLPTKFSENGIEEFLADGVIVLYNIRRGTIRENAIEILKMRGTKHQKKVVAFQITDKGLVVYPEQEVFGGMGEKA
ncbi:MAG: AAA family ATPase [Candidatus Aenigmarchaeota archaeon]|nr:AAA family ATPase [Candidatus Aenigmarchaeota archaeon]